MDPSYGQQIPITKGWDAGMPSAPGFIPIWDQSMAMQPRYEDYLNKNSQGYDAFKKMALRKGPSNWANLATTQQDMLAADQKGKLIQDAGANRASAESALSMQGGLTSGARERAVEGAANNLTGNEQGIARQAGQNKLQISMNDAQNQISQLGSLPGMEESRVSNWANVVGKDQANQMGENKALNDYRQNLYNQQVGAWAANKQADATLNAGKK